jgi:tetratricopeptide (TPR) repeat protein
MTSNLEVAYQDVLHLRLSSAQQSVQKELGKNSENYMSLLIENTIDFFKIFIDENEAQFTKLSGLKNQRIGMLKNSDVKSPYHLFSQAQIALQWSLLNGKFKSYLKAFQELRTAYKLLEKNEQLFPDFLPNKMQLAVLHTLIGTVPNQYKWGAKMLGFEGSVEGGIAEFEAVIQKLESGTKEQHLYRQEAYIMYALLLTHVGNRDEKAMKLLQKIEISADKSPLVAYVLTHFYMHSNQSEMALKILSKTPRGDGFYPFYYLDYLTGLCKLYALDLNSAPYFKTYLQKYSGQHYKKDCNQKLAWLALLKGDNAKYLEYKKMALTTGSALMEADQQALNWAKLPDVENMLLLKARLLFDGGFYAKSIASLKELRAEGFKTQDQQLEFSYRLGRALHKLADYPEAIKNYEQAILLGHDKKIYFACNSALQIATIYETQKKYPQAQQYYQKCLELKPSEYQTSLHQKAKAGLSRIEKK